jgi:hypothetical protein
MQSLAGPQSLRDVGNATRHWKFSWVRTQSVNGLHDTSLASIDRQHSSSGMPDRVSVRIEHSDVATLTFDHFSKLRHRCTISKRLPTPYPKIVELQSSK